MCKVIKKFYCVKLYLLWTGVTGSIVWSCAVTGLSSLRCLEGNTNMGTITSKSLWNIFAPWIHLLPKVNLHTCHPCKYPFNKCVYTYKRCRKHIVCPVPFCHFIAECSEGNPWCLNYADEIPSYLIPCTSVFWKEKNRIVISTVL